MKLFSCWSYLRLFINELPGLIYDSGSDFFFRKITNKLISLLLSEMRDSLMLIEVFLIFVYFLHELLIPLYKIREELTIDTNDNHAELLSESNFILIKWV